MEMLGSTPTVSSTNYDGMKNRKERTRYVLHAAFVFREAVYADFYAKM